MLFFFVSPCSLLSLLYMLHKTELPLAEVYVVNVSDCCNLLRSNNC